MRHGQVREAHDIGHNHSRVIGYLLALSAAAAYGTADFLGGLAVRRAATVHVVLLSQIAGLLSLLLAMPLFQPAQPRAADLWWGALAGIAGGVGVALLYHALSRGRMAIVAPVTAICAVLVPLAADLAGGQSLDGWTATGIGIAGLAIVLVAQGPEPAVAVTASRPQRSVLGEAIASGLIIGVFFLCLARTSADAGLWPLVAARALSILIFGAVAVVVVRESWRHGRQTLWLCVACGVLDIAGNALYLLASRRGVLSVIVTLASLYPACTVLLARVVLHERLLPVQMIGVACAIVAVMLIV